MQTTDRLLAPNAERSFELFPREFFEPSAEKLAPRLLGHFLVHQTSRGPCGGPIVEAEAYLCRDPACHAFNGQTARNRAMWGPPGHAYVYLIYGFHFCVNVVCRPPGIAEAVLIRAIEPAFGLDQMRLRRKSADDTNLTSGPGKLCAALGITRQLDGADLCHPNSPLRLGHNPASADLTATLGPVMKSRRVGLSKAADWPLRFFLEKAPSLSRP